MIRPQCPGIPGQDGHQACPRTSACAHYVAWPAQDAPLPACELLRPADPYQADEAAAFTLAIQAGPAARDTTADLFGYPAELAAYLTTRRTMQ